MTLPGKDHDRQTASPPPGVAEPKAGSEQPDLPARTTRAEAALAAAQNMANSIEQFLLLYAAVSAMEMNTALAAIKAARAVLYLAQTVLSFLLKKQH